MLISKRRNEPAHYMLKIESFSLLYEAQTMKVESDVFEASGHKWRLDLYPNGNEEEEGGDHISLYVTYVTPKVTQRDGKSVDVNFFVYDHIDHTYVLFQDVHGNRTRFNKKKMKWGLAKLISVEYFKEGKNGYLLNDSCVFGAEVFAVTEYTQKDRCLSMTKLSAPTDTHTWRIDNFLATTKKVLYSEIFKAGKVKWKLAIYPKGNAEGEGEHLSIYLRVHDADLLPDGWRVYARFKLRVKNQSDDDDREKETSNWFCNSADDWGFHSFMLLSELSDSAKGFLLSGSLIVEAEISFVGMFRNFI